VHQEIEASGLEGDDGEAAVVAATIDNVHISLPLKGLWRMDDEYVIEGECPVSSGE
jgi:hypothetical protein